MSMNNCNDTIGNRTRDHPACSAVPQPTAPPCAPQYLLHVRKICEFLLQAHTEDFSVGVGGGVGADNKDIYNLCLILENLI
jgi:hypothetical protein